MDDGAAAIIAHYDHTIPKGFEPSTSGWTIRRSQPIELRDQFASINTPRSPRTHRCRLVLHARGIVAAANVRHTHEPTASQARHAAVVGTLGISRERAFFHRVGPGIPADACREGLRRRRCPPIQLPITQTDDVHRRVRASGASFDAALESHGVGIHPGH